MYRIRGNKWNRRICKWIVSLLTVALLVNQNSFWVLAEESVDKICCCDTRCNVDSVNESCLVCVQDNGRCEGAESVKDIDTDAETIPDIPTGEEPENPDERGGQILPQMKKQQIPIQMKL